MFCECEFRLQKVWKRSSRWTIFATSNFFFEFFFELFFRHVWEHFLWSWEKFFQIFFVKFFHFGFLFFQIFFIKFYHFGFLLSMFDVAGQRDQRGKWLQCFNNITAIFFVVPTSGYNILRVDDDSEESGADNRLAESFQVFNMLWNSKWVNVMEKKLSSALLPWSIYGKI